MITIIPCDLSLPLSIYIHIYTHVIIVLVYRRQGQLPQELLPDDAARGQHVLRRAQRHRMSVYI